MHVLQRFKKDNLGTDIPAHAGSDDRAAGVGPLEPVHRDVWIRLAEQIQAV